MRPQLSLPNLIIAGVGKAGTTSLFSYLALHPDICASSIKETCYFLSLRYGGKLPPINQYHQHFRHYSNEKYIMESTPGYFYGGKAVAQAIKQELGHVKIILSFREPVSRLLSSYKFAKSKMKLEQDVSLAEYIQLCENMPPAERRKQENNPYWGIEGGFYADYLSAWFDVFGESVKIIFFEQLQNERFQLLRELCAWLDIEYNFPYEKRLTIENRSINYKNKSLHRVGRFINRKFEIFWRKNPYLKHLVRNIYCLMNEQPFEEDYPDHILEYLESIFRPYNLRLATELSKRGYKDLPSWLTEARETASKAIGNEKEPSKEHKR
jgi:hypothetical protein